MLIKTLLLFDVLLIIDNQKGVQCSKLLSNLLKLDSDTIDYHVKVCFKAEFLFIMLAFNSTKEEYIGDDFTSVKNVYDLTLRLLRLSSMSVYDYSSNPKTSLWNYLFNFTNWISCNSQMYCNKVLLEANILNTLTQINYEKYEKIGYLRPNYSNDENIFKMHNNCRMFVNIFSESSYFMEKHIRETILSQCKKYNGKEHDGVPMLTTTLLYGRILLLITKNDYDDYIQIENISHQRIFILDLISEVLINIYHAILFVLQKIILYGINSEMFKNIQNQSDEVHIKVKLILHLYQQVIKTTKEIHNMDEDRSNYPKKSFTSEDDIFTMNKQVALKISEEYKLFSNKIKEKFSCIVTLGRNAESLEIITTVPTTKKPVYSGSHSNTYNERLTYYSGRLTEYNVNSELEMRVSMIGLYQPFPTDPKYEPNIAEVIQTEDVQLLLDLNAWLVISYHHVRQLKNDQNLTKKENPKKERINELLDKDYRNSTIIIPVY